MGTNSTNQYREPCESQRRARRGDDGAENSIRSFSAVPPHSRSPRKHFGEASIGFAHVKPVLPHFLVERRAVDIQLCRGGLAVPVVALKGLLDDAALGTFECLV